MVIHPISYQQSLSIFYYRTSVLRTVVWIRGRRFIPPPIEDGGLLADKDKVKEVLSRNVDVEIDISSLENDALLISMGFNSINFIKTAIELEEAFGFEFDPDKLGFEFFETVGDLISYVNEMV